MEREYIGDGVYADFDGIMIRAFTHDGVDELETIYFEKDVFEAFVRYGNKIFQKPVLSSPEFKDEIR